MNMETDRGVRKDVCPLCEEVIERAVRIYS